MESVAKISAKAPIIDLKGVVKLNSLPGTPGYYIMPKCPLPGTPLLAYQSGRINPG